MRIEVQKDILGKNEERAAGLKAEFDRRKIFVLNLLGSPGAGKTTLLETTLAELKGEMNIAVIEGDLFTEKDADRIAATGVEVVQLNTMGGCHLEANMIETALENIRADGVDLLIIENVGNLVCPANFALGEDARAVVLSVAEGDDKPLKYPGIFQSAAAVVINKVDLLPYVDFDMAAARRDIAGLNPRAVIAEVSARTGDGTARWLEWLREVVAAKKNG